MHRGSVVKIYQNPTWPLANGVHLLHIWTSFLSTSEVRRISCIDFGVRMLRLQILCWGLSHQCKHWGLAEFSCIIVVFPSKCWQTPSEQKPTPLPRCPKNLWLDFTYLWLSALVSLEQLVPGCWTELFVIHARPGLHKVSSQADEKRGGVLKWICRKK